MSTEHAPGDVARAGALPPAWLAQAVVGRVGLDGTGLAGVTHRLDAIAAEGVTVLSLPPVLSSPTQDRVATYDFLAIDPLLGGDAALRALLDAAHARGIRVVLDVIPGWCGRGFWAFNHVLEAGAASPYRDWFVLDPGRLGPGRGPDAYPERPSPASPDASWTYRELGYEAVGGRPDLPRLNLATPAVRAFLAAVVTHWTRFGVDGLRLLVPDPASGWVPDGLLDILRARARAANPDAAILATAWDGPRDGPATSAPPGGEAGLPPTAHAIVLAGSGPADRRGPAPARPPGAADPSPPAADPKPARPAAIDPTDPPAWVRDAVFYQVLPDRFARSGRVPAPGPLEPWDEPPTSYGFKGGDLYGVADHLDHIADLGATAIYLNPICSSASNHRYHTYDYYRVDPLLGGDAAFRHLLDAAHARGIRVVIDGVFNHSGRGFWPFNHVMEAGAASPYRDWFVLNPAFLEQGRTLRAYAAGHGPELELSAVDLGSRDGTASLRELGYQAWWDLPAVPKINARDAAAREHLLGAAEHWIRFGADGWRLDVPEDLGDRDFWREFRRRVRAINPDAYILAEIWFPLEAVLRGDMYDATMAYGFLTAVASYAGAASIDRRVASEHGWLADSVVPEDGPTFARRLEALLTQFRPAVTAVQYNLLGSHDTPRILSVVGRDADAVRLGTLIQATLPGVPAVYYGDEIGMTGSIDPHARAAFPWSRPDTWDETIRTYLREAFRLRHAEPVLRHGTVRVVAATGSVVAWLRVLGDRGALVACNNGAQPETVRVEVPELAGRRLQPAPLPGSAVATPPSSADGSLELTVPPRSGIVLLG